MPTQKFFLDDQKTQQVEISWRGFWKDITVKHNGNIIGEFQNLSHLKQGQTFHLPDGSPLSVHYSTAYLDQGMKVEHNWRPVKGSMGDPQTRLKNIYGLAIFIGGLNIVIGAIGEFGDVEFLKQLGAGWVLMLIGAIVVALGYCVYKFRSVAALIAIIGLIVIDIVAYFLVAMESGGRPGVGGIALKVFMIMAMLKGFSAIRDIKEAETFGDTKRSPFL